MTAQAERALQQQGVQPVAGLVVVAAPGEGRLPIPAGELPVVGRRCGEPVLADVRLQLLGALDVAVAHLQGPVGGRIEAQTAGPGVQSKGIEVPAVLVRLAAIEHRALDLPGAMDEAGGDHPEGDVGGIQPMMGDRRGRIVHPREAVHEGDGPQRRLARIAGIEEHRRRPADRKAVGARQLHEEVVRMLPVDQGRHPIGGLAGLQQQGITILAHGRIQREHGAQG